MSQDTLRAFSPANIREYQYMAARGLIAATVRRRLVELNRFSAGPRNHH